MMADRSDWTDNSKKLQCRYKKSVLLGLLLVISYTLWNTIDFYNAPRDQIDYFKASQSQLDTFSFMHSAYEDDRTYQGKPLTEVKVIGFSHRIMEYHLYCYFFDKKTLLYKVKAVPSYFDRYRETHQERLLNDTILFAAGFSCMLSKSLAHKGDLNVSLLPGGLENKLDIIKIYSLSITRTQQNQVKPLRNFTVCISPIFGDITANSFMEMVELNLHFGANFISIYNYSIPKSLDKIVDYYQSKGILEVVQWPSNKTILNRIIYFGQCVAINDCLYRQMSSSKYTIFTDLDEVIVPKAHGSWGKMMQEIHDDRYSSYMFRNVFYRYNLSASKEKLKSESILWWNDRTAHPPKVRSKILVNSRATFSVGVHEPFILAKGTTNFVVPLKVGHLAHFKNMPTNKVKGVNRFWRNVSREVRHHYNHRLRLIASL